VKRIDVSGIVERATVGWIGVARLVEFCTARRLHFACLDAPDHPHRSTLGSTKKVPRPLLTGLGRAETTS
jgi:hypothetical protein